MPPPTLCMSSLRAWWEKLRLPAGLTMLWNVMSIVPHGGIFLISIMGNPWGFVAEMIIGSLITAAVMTMLQPVLKASDAQSDTEEEPEIDDFEISIKH